MDHDHTPQLPPLSGASKEGHRPLWESDSPVQTAQLRTLAGIDGQLHGSYLPRVAHAEFPLYPSHASTPLLDSTNNSLNLDPNNPQSDSAKDSKALESNRKRRRRDGPSRATVAYPRKRAIAACQLCRARKIKCNNARPSCRGCLASGAACVYEDSDDQSTFDTASILILEKLNQVLSRLDKPPTIPGDHSQSSIAPDGWIESDQSPYILSGEPHVFSDQGEDRGRDHLLIPSARTTPDALLQWPVFEGRFPPNFIIDATFLAEAPDEDWDADADDSRRDGSRQSRRQRDFRPRTGGFDEDDVLSLVQRFLSLVHIKNPILDVDTLWSSARRVAEDGLDWDMESCLVLIACALGCVAQEYQPDHPLITGTTSLEGQGDALSKGELYYNLARRRLGLLDRGIRAAQCHFLVGVYLMYTMRPLTAWSQFQAASQSYHIYLECQARRPPMPQMANPAQAIKRRRLEQRIYWSCYKSECELRAEMELPNSSLADCPMPDMHPSPPEVPSPRPVESPGDLSSSARGNKALESHRYHEQTWFYYLTEIMLRRMGNRILNILYTADHTSWTEDRIPSLCKTAEEFEHQISEWYQGLPPPIQYKDDVIPQEELPYMVRGRVLGMKEWVYRPFLYYIIHHPPGAPHRELALPFAVKALQIALVGLGRDPLQHRHHGSWYGIRSMTASALSVLGAVKSGNVCVSPEWKSSVHSFIEQLKYWEDETPVACRAIQVIQDYLADP